MEIFDSHFHIINPIYPVDENNGYLPSKFTVEDYRERTINYNIVGGAIVSASYQAFHQEYLIDELSKLGNNYFGVANIPLAIKAEELKRLQKVNVVAVRFNLKRSAFHNLKDIDRLSNHLYENYGWHAEFYVDSKDLKSLKTLLENIPKFSLDHLGLSKEGLSELYHWVEKGAKVKASGFGRINFKPIPVMKKIFEINPDSLMFGTDLPSTRAKSTFSARDINLIKDNFTEFEQHKIFFANASEWYSR